VGLALARSVDAKCPSLAWALVSFGAVGGIREGIPGWVGNQRGTGSENARSNKFAHATQNLACPGHRSAAPSQPRRMGFRWRRSAGRSSGSALACRHFRRRHADLGRRNMQSTCGIGGGELVSRLAGEAVDSLTECDAGVGRGMGGRGLDWATVGTAAEECGAAWSRPDRDWRRRCSRCRWPACRAASSAGGRGGRGRITRSASCGRCRA